MRKFSGGSKYRRIGRNETHPPPDPLLGEEAHHPNTRPTRARTYTRSFTRTHSHTHTHTQTCHKAHTYYLRSLIVHPALRSHPRPAHTLQTRERAHARTPPRKPFGTVGEQKGLKSSELCILPDFLPLALLSGKSNFCVVEHSTDQVHWTRTTKIPAARF